VDTGRLGIPVYMSMCGPGAAQIMPVRKQMGKGASADQAMASALMELVERYSFFSFWQTTGPEMTWSEAEKTWGRDLISLDCLAKAAHSKDTDQLGRILDLVPWRFAPVTDFSTMKQIMAPVDLFRSLNEFNGSSAGNTLVEAVLQGACELVERHVCVLAEQKRPALPTIDLQSCTDPVLKNLIRAFEARGIQILLKNFSLGLPAPTVAAVAMDPSTFPHSSEIVYTAGTATDPQKACIRALTEIAQLAGDFCTSSVYEASGLPKLLAPEETAWLKQGPVRPVSSLPSLAHQDMAQELSILARKLSDLNFSLLALDLTHPVLDLPAVYTMIPGFQFRERDPHASAGMFVARKLVEQHCGPRAEIGLTMLEELDPGAHYIPFSRAMNHLNQENFGQAAREFAQAEEVQPDDATRAMAAFYQAYALTREELWADALPHLDRALELDPDSREYFNLRGVCRFKAHAFEAAARDFARALSLDKGSAMDWANLGMCLKKTGKAGEAAEHLARALELDPELEFARRALEELRFASNP
jgi:ribosomal protein S12 methylthiotransferase accessory factor